MCNYFIYIKIRNFGLKKKQKQKFKDNFENLGALSNENGAKSNVQKKIRRAQPTDIPQGQLSW
jgi:hypothetical protein